MNTQNTQIIAKGASRLYFRRDTPCVTTASFSRPRTPRSPWLNSLLFASVVSFCSILSAPAQAPLQFAYQGRLTDSNGVPVVGAVNATFNIIKGGSPVSGGTTVYVDNVTSVTTDVNGVFSHAIGNSPPLTIAALGDGLEPRFVEAIVNGERLLPRHQLIAVPYAIIAQTVQGSNLFVSPSTGHIGLGTTNPVASTTIASTGATSYLDTQFASAHTLWQQNTTNVMGLILSAADKYANWTLFNGYGMRIRQSGTNDAMILVRTDDGKPYVQTRRPVFYAHRDDTVHLNAGTSLVTFNEVIDPYGEFDDGGDRFIASMTGYYFFFATIHLDSLEGTVDDEMSVAFDKNSGSHVASVYYNPAKLMNGTNTQQPISMFVIVYMIPGDTMRVIVRDISASNSTRYFTRNFGGFYVGF